MLKPYLLLVTRVIVKVRRRKVTLSAGLRITLRRLDITSFNVIEIRRGHLCHVDYYFILGFVLIFLAGNLPDFSNASFILT